MECPHIPEISYGKFSEEVHKNLDDKRIPLSGALELTFKCNLNCKHCYCPQNPCGKELSTEEIFKIINEITEAGCLWFLFSGGEPLLRKDFQRIYLYAKRKGLLIYLFTNGTLLTEEIADFLARWRPFSIEIPLYGIRKGTYERVVNSPHSFGKCLRSIELIKERNLSLKLKTLVTKDNLSEIPEIRKYAEDLGFEFRHDCLINPRLDGSKQPCQLRVSPRDVVDLDIADERRLPSYKRFCEKFWGSPPPSNRVFTCEPARASFHINPYGILFPCTLTRSPNYNLREGTFNEGWKKIFQEIRALKIKRDYPCRSCELFSLCDQCPGFNYLEGGDYETKLEFLCEITHLRIEELEKRYKLGKWAQKEVRTDEEKVLQTRD